MSYTQRRTALAGLLWMLLLVSSFAPALLAQPKPNETDERLGLAEPTTAPALTALDSHALIALPLATALGADLAVRPRRRGTPQR